MQRRVFWESGMRVRNTILQASDDAHFAWVDKAITLASAGRFGLIPNNKPFDIDLTVETEFITIDRLTCFALTPGQNMIDIDFTGPVKCRKGLPQSGATDILLLIIKVTDKWEKSNDVFEEPVYEYDIIKPNSDLPSNAFPIARLVAQNNVWKEDDDYVPPCLFVASHEKYKDQLDGFLKILNKIEEKTQPLLKTETNELIAETNELIAMSVLLPLIQRTRIDTDWGRDLLTPADFVANLQKVIGALYTVGVITDTIDPNQSADFKKYTRKSYNLTDVYPIVKEGVILCDSINYRIEKWLNEIKTKPKEEPVKTSSILEAPSILESHRIQNCSSAQISIPVYNIPIGATVYYSTDGSTPTRVLSGNFINLETGYDPKKRMPDRIIIINLKAVVGGRQSTVVQYPITLHYEFKAWNGYTI